MLEAIHVGKSFGGNVALADVSLGVRPGEFFSLLGPSGCGKTTLLRMLAGFESPDAGGIFLDGVNISTQPAHKRPFNMVFQRYALFPHLDVGRNVAFGLECKGISGREVRKRVDEALALVAMTAFARRRIETLSGGQQQRVAIARAIVNRPKVLLLDEPLSALDLKLRQRMQVELLTLQRQLGMTFLYVTHAQDEALTLSDRIAVMNRGRIEQIGTPREVYDRPVTPFVATFIGQVNRIPGHFVGKEQGAAIMRSDSGAKLRGQLTPGSSPAPDQPVTLLVRPECVRVAASPPASELNHIEAKLTRVLFKGNSVEVLADDFTVSLNRDRAADIPEPGQRLGLCWHPNDALIMCGEVPT